MSLEVRLPEKLHVISKQIAALALILMLAACDKPGSTTDIDQMPPQAVQPSDNALVRPERYLRLGDLAGAIRKAGHACEVVRAYKLIERKDKGSDVYKIDCLEYSYRLTISNGQSHIERLTANVTR